MSIQAALKSDLITDADLEALVAMRSSKDALKRRLEALDESCRGLEAQLVDRIESGAGTSGQYDVQIKTIERRFPSWKNHFIELAGTEAAEEILERTKPTCTKSLIVK